ncbi:MULTISPECIES: hypothetical protein [Pseudomonas]|jgi:hypothetical protein|uniref:hypothetical protein n=1 Tax=Pseudomonas TaxID=286 RepID=UPI00257B9DA5|nr:MULTISPECIES: hypothetical protein [Pseudomonas]
MRVRLLLIRALQSMGLVLVGYLFILAMTASLRETPFSMSLPYLGDSDNSALDLALFCVPGMLLFVLLGSTIRRRRVLGGVFAAVAAVSAWLLCELFSTAFGNTWSTSEVLGLLVLNLHWWLLALVPGLMLLFALERFASKAGSYKGSGIRL